MANSHTACSASERKIGRDGGDGLGPGRPETVEADGLGEGTDIDAPAAGGVEDCRLEVAKPLEGSADEEVGRGSPENEVTERALVVVETCCTGPPGLPTTVEAVGCCLGAPGVDVDVERTTPPDSEEDSLSGPGDGLGRDELAGVDLLYMGCPEAYWTNEVVAMAEPEILEEIEGSLLRLATDEEGAPANGMEFKVEDAPRLGATVREIRVPDRAAAEVGPAAVTVTTEVLAAALLIAAEGPTALLGATATLASLEAAEVLEIATSFPKMSYHGVSREQFTGVFRCATK